MGRALRHWRLGLALAALAAVGLLAVAGRPGRGSAGPARVLVVGDSIAAGVGQHPHWTHYLPQYRFTCRVRPGAASREVLEQLGRGSAGYQAVVICTGTSDGLTGVPIAEYRRHLLALVRLAGVGRVVLVAPLPVMVPAGDMRGRQVRPYRREMQAVARETGAYCLPPCVPARREYFVDAVHLNGRGGRLLAEGIGKALAEVTGGTGG